MSEAKTTKAKLRMVYKIISTGFLLGKIRQTDVGIIVRWEGKSVSQFWWSIVA